MARGACLAPHLCARESPSDKGTGTKTTWIFVTFTVYFGRIIHSPWLTGMFDISLLLFYFLLFLFRAVLCTGLRQVGSFYCYTIIILLSTILCSLTLSLWSCQIVVVPSWVLLHRSKSCEEQSPSGFGQLKSRSPPTLHMLIEFGWVLPCSVVDHPP